MNSIRAIRDLNRRELENNVSTEASWHVDYRDTAYIYIGGFPFDLSEGDILTIFSQYGEPTYINLIRDKESGKSKGFAFLKYEDQRSTDLAVDNLGGASIMGRILKVDHTRYKKKEGEAETGMDLGALENGNEEEEESEVEQRPMLKEEKELMLLIRDHDEDDPMKEFMVQEKKEEVAKALARVKDETPKDKKHRHHHRKHEHHKHRSRRHSDGEENDGERHRNHKSSRRRSRSP